MDDRLAALDNEVDVRDDRDRGGLGLPLSGGVAFRIWREAEVTTLIVSRALVLEERPRRGTGIGCVTLL